MTTYEINLSIIPELEIIETVYLACGVEYNDLNLLLRKEKCVMAKFISVFLLEQKKTKRKTTCELLGYKDHTTLIHALKVIDFRLKHFREYKISFMAAMEMLELRILKKQKPIIYSYQSIT